jgi:hypothetical protein
MKNIFYILLLVLPICTYAQWNQSGDNYTTGKVGIGTTTPNASAKLHVYGGDFILEPSSGNPILYTGTGAAEFNRYLSLINSATSGYSSASGLKAGGILVSDTYGYANPGKNDLVVKGRTGIGTASPEYSLQIYDSNNPTLAIGKASLTTSGKSSLWFYAGDITTQNGFCLQYNKDAATDRLAFIDGGLKERMTILNGGNVGIGTADPTSLLTLNRSGTGAQTSAITLQSNATNVGSFGWTAGGMGYLDIRALYDNNHIILSPSGNGYVGIGTVSPTSLLTLNKNGTGAQTSALTIQSNNTNVASIGWTAAGMGFVDIRALYDNNHIILTPSGTGNVGIGTTSPDAKLTVKGDVHTREVRVDMTGAVGPDYVFEKNYDLLSLTELETYINQNKHLPEVPSAKEMEKDGLNLKEMNLILLKKVEELTLHLIEMKKEIEVLKRN